jgi:hypothetical protein
MKAESAVFAETPIYSRLVAERGDILAQTRNEADRLHRRLAQVIPSDTSSPGRPRSGDRGTSRSNMGAAGGFFTV